MLDRRIALAAVALLAACPSMRTLGEARRAEESGDAWTAAERYLDAAPRSAAHRGLERVGAQAVDAAIERAVALETEGRALDAKIVYEQTRDLIRRLEAAGIAVPPFAVDLDERIAATRDAAVVVAVRSGRALLDASAFEDAAAAFRRALSLDPRNPAARKGLADAYVAWAERLVARSRWREAAERFADAAASGDPEAGARARGLYAALGEWHLDHGHCRQAAADLGRAGLGHPRFAEARACAEVRVWLPRPAADAASGQDVVFSALADALLERTSEHVVLVEAPDPPADVDYAITGSVVELGVTGPVEERRVETAMATRLVPCPSSVDGCERDVDLRYELVESTLDATAGVALRVSVPATRQVVLRDTWFARRTDLLRWVEDIRQEWTGRSVMVAGRWDALVMDDDLAALAEARRTHRPAAELLELAVADLAHDVAVSLATVIDGGESVDDPDVLEVR